MLIYEKIEHLVIVYLFVTYVVVMPWIMHVTLSNHICAMNTMFVFDRT